MRIATFGLWVFTMFEFLTALFESTSALLVVDPDWEDKGASGRSWGQYGTAPSSPVW